MTKFRNEEDEKPVSLLLNLDEWGGVSELILEESAEKDFRLDDRRLTLQLSLRRERIYYKF